MFSVKKREISYPTKLVLYGLSPVLWGLVACAPLNTQADQTEIIESAVVMDLVDEPRVKQALQFLHDEDARNVRDLIELTEIPAPPFQEALRAKRFAEMLREAGLSDVSIDEVGNVIGVRPGVDSKRRVAIVAHIDTVFPIETDVTVRQEGDTYYAPGIGDNSRGLVMALSLLRAFETLSISTEAEILFVGSVGEEGLGDLRGVRHLLREGGPPIDSFIAIDGGSNGRVVHSAVGSTRYRVTVHGPGGHSWGAFGIANPHHAVASSIARFVDKARPISEESEKATFSIGRVGGGTSINSIASEAWFEVDMRSGSPSLLRALDGVLHDSVEAAVNAHNSERARGEPLSVDFASVGNRPAGATPAAASLVQNAVTSISYLGVEPRLTQSSTDANIPMSMGIPAITISRGGITSRAHSKEESWQNVDSHLALQSGFLILLAEAGLAD